MPYTIAIFHPYNNCEEKQAISRELHGLVLLHVVQMSALSNGGTRRTKSGIVFYLVLW